MSAHGLTPDELRRFALALQARRRELIANSALAEDARRVVELDQTAIGRVSRQDALQQQAMAKAQDHRRVQEMRRIDAALKRIDTGEFGYCDTCGEPINPKRLDVDPTSAACVSCSR